jgi:arylsulfatase A-like enzyme
MYTKLQKLLPGLILLGVLVCSCSSDSAPVGEPAAPNIVFIMTDDQSPIPVLDAYCDQSRPFGFNGDPHVLTPVIDSLASKGMVFTRAYVSSSVCSPSRYSILTGRYAGRCRGSRFSALFPKGEPTRIENNTELEEDGDNLPRLLQKAGYRTGFVGKCHVVDHHLLPARNWEANGLKPYDSGADPRDPEVSEAMAHNHQHWARRILDFGFDYANAIYAANLKELQNDSLNVHNIEWKVRAALDFIEDSGEDPFFLYYSETVPHGPAPWEKPGGNYSYGLDANPGFTSRGFVDDRYAFMPPREAIQEEVESQGKDPDHAWLRWFDYAVGAIVHKLEEKGKLENTLIVITSDHGNYDFAKSTLYEGGVKVPLLMFWPAGIPKASVYEELVQNIDYAPTFLDLAGVDLSASGAMDGSSLKQVLRGSKEAVHTHLFFELGFARGVATRDWKYIAVRYDERTQKEVDAGKVYTGWNNHQHKLPYYIRNSHLGYHAALLNPHYFEQDQLYHLTSDPEENINLFEKNPEKAREMKALLLQDLESFPNRPFGEFIQK